MPASEYRCVPVVPYRVLSYPVVSYCVLSCPVVSCCALSPLSVLSCPVPAGPAVASFATGSVCEASFGRLAERTPIKNTAPDKKT
jgi:hypothetical protein